MILLEAHSSSIDCSPTFRWPPPVNAEVRLNRGAPRLLPWLERKPLSHRIAFCALCAITRLSIYARSAFGRTNSTRPTHHGVAFVYKNSTDGGRNCHFVGRKSAPRLHFRPNVSSSAQIHGRGGFGSFGSFGGECMCA